MKKAFTLIELLVVIAIIAILAAILFPVFAQAKAAAKKTACLSNQKQIGTCFQMYLNDADDMYPNTSWEKGPGITYQVHWSYLVQPYVKNVNIFVCPTDDKPVKPNDPVNDLQVPAFSYINNYAVIPAHDFLPVNSSAFGAPADLIVLTERRTKTDGMTGTTVIGPWKGTSGFTNPGRGGTGQECSFERLGTNYFQITPAQAMAAVVGTNDKMEIVRVMWERHNTNGLHNGGANYMMADTHARYQTLSQTLDPNHFQWGEYFYPREAPATTPWGASWNTDCH